MNIQPITYNNVPMTGKAPNSSSSKSFYDKIKQKMLDMLPSATYDDKGKLKRWEKVEQWLSRPAENRFTMGATAILTQPAIDSFNPRVSDETRTISRNRTAAKVLVGTTVGIIVRGSCYKLVEKMTDPLGTKKYSNTLIPKNYLNKFKKELTLLKNYRSALSTAVAILVMTITNFAIDAPLTAFLTNRLNAKSLARMEADEKEVVYD